MMLDLRHISTDKLRTAWEEDFNLLLFMSLLKSKWYKGLIKQNDLLCILVSYTCTGPALALTNIGGEIFHTLSQVLDIRLKPNPMIALFGIMQSEEVLTTAKKCALSFACLLA